MVTMFKSGITIEEIVEKKKKVMDLTGVRMCTEN